VLNGECAPVEDQVDVAALAARTGARFVAGRLAGLDREAGRAILDDGRDLPFDLISLALGSETAPLPGAAALPDRVFPAKPIPSLWRLRQALERRFAMGEAVRAVVAGGGITGAEIAASLAGLAARRGGRLRVTLLAGDGPPLRNLPPTVSGPLLESLRRRGVEVTPGRITAIHPDRLDTSAGPLPFDVVALATGLRPPALLATFGLPLAEDGGLVVDHHLRSPLDARVHGAGDCVALQGHRLPRAGVFAVRQAPVLLHNLLAAAGGGAPRRFRPQRHHLWIMNLGDGTGFASRGARHLQGRLALRWKNWLDRRFLDQFRA